MSRSDREMLELAAKAAGVESDPDFGFGTWVGATAGNRYFQKWNPLEDDGDALRLAVKLRMSVDCDDYANLVLVHTQAGEMVVDEDIKDCDPNAATRRAITRAAVEIGKTIKS